MGSTIYALSSGRGRAGIAVIRVSGPRARAVVRALAGQPELRARVATRVRLVHEASGQLLDEAVAVWFPGPGSYTGEDVLELHLHGGRAVLEGVLGALAQIKGLRLAEPGEFTRRAFANGKLDLTEAEAVADLIDAETTAQRDQALRQMRGALGDLYERWRQTLLEGLAHLEASIDFADEDLPVGLVSQVKGKVAFVAGEMATHLGDRHRGEILRDGVQIAIVGATNVGKSSLLNAIAKRDVAIVSAIAGTTRDVIEVHLDLGGYPAVLADTAGLRVSGDVIEQEGVRRAQTRAQTADLRVAVFDAETWPAADPETSSLVDASTVVVVNKIDLRPQGGLKTFKNQTVYGTSARTGLGIPELLGVLTGWVAGICASGEAPVITRARHREALKECHLALARCAEGSELELVAEDLRLATRSLGRITGKVDVEDMLDVIFRDFCIGK